MLGEHRVILDSQHVRSLVWGFYGSDCDGIVTTWHPSEKTRAANHLSGTLASPFPAEDKRNEAPRSKRRAVTGPLQW